MDEESDLEKTRKHLELLKDDPSELLKKSPTKYLIKPKDFMFIENLDKLMATEVMGMEYSNGIWLKDGVISYMADHYTGTGGRLRVWVPSSKEGMAEAMICAEAWIGNSRSRRWKFEADRNEYYVSMIEDGFDKGSGSGSTEEDEYKGFSKDSLSQAICRALVMAITA